MNIFSIIAIILSTVILSGYILFLYIRYIERRVKPATQIKPVGKELKFEKSLLKKVPVG